MNGQHAIFLSIHHRHAQVFLLTAALGYVGPSLAGEMPVKACTKTKTLALSACVTEVFNDGLLAKAGCINLVDPQAREACLEDSEAAQQDSMKECFAQKRAREDLCDLLGEAPYDPSAYWKAENFVDPTAIGRSVAANPYMPLVPGTQKFEGEDETVTVTVTGDTKLIAGVTCVVVNDTVHKEGQLLEDTADWFAQDVQGNVWYCGEISQNYELFAGDVPELPELVDVEGSWKAFRAGALPGILMPAAPQAGKTYRQEMLLGTAEDAAQIITSKADGMLKGDHCAEDGAEIAAWIDRQCNKNCVVTNDFSPLSPGNTEHKYYAPGIGFVLEVNPDGECLVLDAD